MVVDCIWLHENIDRLFEVAPVPMDQLPQVCVCGAKITYSEDLVFINRVGGNDLAESFPYPK